MVFSRTMKYFNFQFYKDRSNQAPISSKKIPVLLSLKFNTGPPNHFFLYFQIFNLIDTVSTYFDTNLIKPMESLFCNKLKTYI